MNISKTTASGVLLALGIIMNGMAALFDGDAATQMDVSAMVEAVGAVIAAVAAFTLGKGSRDDKMSDEEAGAK